MPATGQVVTLGGPKLVSPLGLTLLAAAIAALVMPQQSPFPYGFEYGQPWSYETLTAPFDFEVLYPEEQVRDKISAINDSHAPYYSIDLSIPRRQAKVLDDFIKERLQLSQNDTQYGDLVSKPRQYQAYGERMLAFIYAQGIAGKALVAIQQEDPSAPIYVVRNNTEQARQAKDIPSPKKVLTWLIDTLPYSNLRQPELLLPVLEKMIEANVFYSDSLTAAAKRKKIASVISTGITVRKGDIVVERGTIIDDAIYRKLDSLKDRLAPPTGIPVLTGYALLASSSVRIVFYLVAKNVSSHMETTSGTRIWPNFDPEFFVLDAGLWLDRPSRGFSAAYLGNAASVQAHIRQWAGYCAHGDNAHTKYRFSRLECGLGCYSIVRNGHFAFVGTQRIQMDTASLCSLFDRWTTSACLVGM